MSKAFDEWWAGAEDNFFTYEGVEFPAAEAAWKAALEWVRNQCHEATDGEGIPTGYLFLKQGVLEEELKEH